MFRDIVCLVALRLKGRMAELVRTAPVGLQLVSALLQRLDADQERMWIDHFLQELIEVRVSLIAVGPVDVLCSFLIDPSEGSPACEKAQPPACSCRR